MSCSKHQVVADNKTPKCARCRHHGYVVPQKGHTRVCPFLQCTCWKCALVTERSRIGALQRKMRDDHPKKMTASGAAGGGGDGGTEPEPEPPQEQPMAMEEAPGRGMTSCRSSSAATVLLGLDDDPEEAGITNMSVHGHSCPW